MKSKYGRRLPIRPTDRYEEGLNKLIKSKQMYTLILRGVTLG